MNIRFAMPMAAVILLSASAWADETPKAELNLDYSFARYNPSASYTKGHSLNGGGGGIKFNISEDLGIMADFQGYNSNTTFFNVRPNQTFPGGAHGSVSGNLFTYMFGPVVKFHLVPHAHPYFDLLFGAAHSNVYGNAYKTLCQPIAPSGCTVHTTPNGNGFALSAGGGLDVPINSYVDFRVGEFDYLYTRFTNIFNSTGQNNFRYIGGLVIKFGTPSPKPTP